MLLCSVRARARALVVLACTPVMVILVGLFFVVLTGSAKVNSKAYATAGGIANEALFSMRTVASLCLEQTFQKRYTANLVKPQRHASACCPAGSLVLYDPRTMHRGGANSSHADRPMVYLTCAALEGVVMHQRNKTLRLVSRDDSKVD